MLFDLQLHCIFCPQSLKGTKCRVLHKNGFIPYFTVVGLGHKAKQNQLLTTCITTFIGSSTFRQHTGKKKNTLQYNNDSQLHIWKVYNIINNSTQKYSRFKAHSRVRLEQPGTAFKKKITICVLLVVHVSTLQNEYSTFC